MICKECGSQMYLDDRDFNFKGNYDNYYNCEHCNTSCIQRIRFGQIWVEDWHTENNNEVRDYQIKHKITR